MKMKININSDYELTPIIFEVVREGNIDLYTLAKFNKTPINRLMLFTCLLLAYHPIVKQKVEEARANLNIKSFNYPLDVLSRFFSFCS